MSDVVIKAENLGKKYTIGGSLAALRTGKQERYRTPSTKLSGQACASP